MLRDKKGVEISLNMIVMTVIALLVLMVVIFFIIKNVGNSNNATACENNKGICIAQSAKCTDEYPVSSPLSCPKDQKCCTNFGGIGGS